VNYILYDCNLGTCVRCSVALSITRIAVGSVGLFYATELHEMGLNAGN